MALAKLCDVDVYAYIGPLFQTTLSLNDYIFIFIEVRLEGEIYIVANFALKLSLTKWPIFI